MAVRAHLPGYNRLRVFQSAAVRTGIYLGFCLAIVLIGWVLAANRAPFLERFALERNLLSASLMALLAMIPFMRFYRHPTSLLASGVIAWAILSFVYRVLSLFFPGLPERHSAFQIFTLGVVVYLIVATVCWLCIALWRARHDHISHPNHT
jgi:hypothetical protein